MMVCSALVARRGICLAFSPMEPSETHLNKVLQALIAGDLVQNGAQEVLWEQQHSLICSAKPRHQQSYLSACHIHGKRQHDQSRTESASEHPSDEERPLW